MQVVFTQTHDKDDTLAPNVKLGGSIENLFKSLCGRSQETKISGTYRVHELFLFPIIIEWIPWFLSIYPPKV
jgi:hypothetical protein